MKVIKKHVLQGLLVERGADHSRGVPISAVSHGSGVFLSLIGRARHWSLYYLCNTDQDMQDLLRFAPAVHVLSTIVALNFSLSPRRASAQWPPKNPGLPVTDLIQGFTLLVQAALLLVGVLALGFLVYGGFLYITSQGDQNQLETAKSTITHAVIGIAVIGLAYAIVAFVFRAFYEG